MTEPCAGIIMEPPLTRPEATGGIGLLAWRYCPLAPGEEAFKPEPVAFLVDTDYVKYAFYSGRCIHPGRG